MHPSKRIGSIQSPIIQVLQKHFTPSTISLAQGVPFFPPPQDALLRMQQLMKTGNYHTYSPDAGLPELREAIAGKLEMENGIKVEPSQVMVTAGANQGFVNAALAIGDPGDEIILLRPYYFNHEMALKMFGIVPRIVDCDENHQPKVEMIEEAITPETRAVVTISPNNPTGAVYPKRTLQAINALCKDHDIYHISDEPYEYFIFGEDPHYSPGSGGEEHTITLHSFSKTYGMSGWRVGYICYPEQLCDDLLKVQDTIVICPTVAAQLLALECQKVGKGYVESFLPRIRESRDIVLSYLKEPDDLITMPVTTGGYYFYVKVDTPRTGMEIAIRLIREFDVAVVPGGPFGSTDGCYLRLSYGNVTPEKAEEGMKRFIKGINSLVH